MQTIPLALLAAMLLTGAAVAGPVEDADEAYRRGDYQTALRLAEPLADGGDRAAQFRLGVMYEQGKSVPQDYTEAANWYRRSADQGYGQGQNNLGNL
jgi:TPR repeat protein